MNKFIKCVIIFIITVVVCLTINYFFFAKSKEKSQTIATLEDLEKKKSPIILLVDNGSMFYSPVNETEAFMIHYVNDLPNDIYFFSDDKTISITDDIMVTNQKGVYAYLYSIINKGTVSKSKDVNTNNVITDYIIEGADAIQDLLVDDWGLTTGQSTGALNVYEAFEAKNAKLLLSIDQTYGFEFTVVLIVDDEKYKIYDGMLMTNKDTGFEVLNPDLLDVRTYAGKAITDESLTNYRETVSNFLASLPEHYDIEQYHKELLDKE